LKLVEAEKTFKKIFRSVEIGRSWLKSIKLDKRKFTNEKYRRWKKYLEISNSLNLSFA